MALDLGWGHAWGIIGATVLMRTLLMPITLVTQKNMHKMKLIDPEIQAYRTKMMDDYKSGNRARADLTKQELDALMKRYGVSNTLPLLNLLTMPFFISFFISLRYMVFTPELFPGVSGLSFFWITDLSTSDPYFVLPLISAFLNLGSIHVNRKLNPISTSTPAAIKKFHQFLPVLPFFGAAFMSTFPAGLNLYWMMRF